MLVTPMYEALYHDPHCFYNLEVLHLVGDFDWVRPGKILRGCEHEQLPSKLVNESNCYFPKLTTLSISPHSPEDRVWRARHQGLDVQVVWKFLNLCLMGGAPRLSTLSLHHLRPFDRHHGISLDPIRRRLSTIIRLELHYFEAPKEDLSALLAGFPGLRDVKYKDHAELRGKLPDSNEGK